MFGFIKITHVSINAFDLQMMNIKKQIEIETQDLEEALAKRNIFTEHYARKQLQALQTQFEENKEILGGMYRTTYALVKSYSERFTYASENEIINDQCVLNRIRNYYIYYFGANQFARLERQIQGIPEEPELETIGGLDLEVKKEVIKVEKK